MMKGEFVKASEVLGGEEDTVKELRDINSDVVSALLRRYDASRDRLLEDIKKSFSLLVYFKKGDENRYHLELHHKSIEMNGRQLDLNDTITSITALNLDEIVLKHLIYPVYEHLIRPILALEVEEVDLITKNNQSFTVCCLKRFALYIACIFSHSI